MRLGIEKVFIWYLMIIINEYYASFLNIAKIMTYIVNIGNILTIDLVFFSAISNQIDSLQFPEVLHFKEIFQRLEKHFVKKRQPNSMLKCVH